MGLTMNEKKAVTRQIRSRYQKAKRKPSPRNSWPLRISRSGNWRRRFAVCGGNERDGGGLISRCRLCGLVLAGKVFYLAGYLFQMFLHFRYLVFYHCLVFP